MYVTESHTASLHITETPPAHRRRTINSRVFVDVIPHWKFVEYVPVPFQRECDVPAKFCELHSGMNFVINKGLSKVRGT